MMSSSEGSLVYIDSGLTHQGLALEDQPHQRYQQPLIAILIAMVCEKAETVPRLEEEHSALRQRQNKKQTPRKEGTRLGKERQLAQANEH